MIYPSTFLDAYGRFSAVDLPGLGTSRLGLRSPDPLIAINGSAVRCDMTRAYPLRCLQPLFAEAARAGRGEVDLRFDHAGTAVEIRRTLATIGAHELVPLFLVYAVVGLLALCSGLMVLAQANPSIGAHAYAAWTASSALFFFTFFDYHTTAYLAPVFSFSTVAVEVAFLWLAFAFPTPLRSRGLLRGLAVVTVCGVAMGVWLVIAPLVFHRDPVLAREVVGVAALPTLGALFVTMVARWYVADAATRRELRSAAIGLALVPALIGLGIALANTTGVDLIHAFLPLLGLLMPLSIGYALIRRNVLGARAVVSRAIFELPALAFAIVVGCMLWLELPPGLGVASALVGGFTVWLGLTRSFASRLFPARKSFRPSIEALKDVLGERRRAPEVAEALASIVERWLSIESARVVLADRFGDEHMEGAGRARLEQGHLDVDGDGIGSPIRVPVRALGELRAVLIVGRKRDGAPFNLDDVALLDTIAGFGGLALHHAHVLEELDQLRRADLDAAGREKQATVALVGAEVAHEVAYSLNYLRFLLRGDRTTISSDDIEIGRDEIARLERMLGALRRLAPPPPQLSPVNVAAPIRQARSLVREQVAERAVRFEVDDTAHAVLADRDQLVQVLANLFRNAVQAVAVGGEVCVRCSQEHEIVTIRVIDDGPGVPDHLNGRLFTPWATGRPGGTGLGLAVAARIAHGWGGSLRYERRDGRTEFRLDMPEARR